MHWADELTEFEFAARTAPVGDAEAYGRSLGEPEVDLDAVNEDLKDLQKELEALEQQLLGSDEEKEEKDKDKDKDKDKEEDDDDNNK
jgi:hypothetical protein